MKIAKYLFAILFCAMLFSCTEEPILREGEDDPIVTPPPPPPPKP
jgi:hypothetical protein